MGCVTCSAKVLYRHPKGCRDTHTVCLVYIQSANVALAHSSCVRQATYWKGKK